MQTHRILIWNYHILYQIHNINIFVTKTEE